MSTINGRKAFEHSCQSTGMTPSEIWITPFMIGAKPDLNAPQTNALAVCVNNRSSMGGIWQPVYLVASDAALDLKGAQAAVNTQPSPATSAGRLQTAGGQLEHASRQ